jgi:hypothetical protein
MVALGTLAHLTYLLTEGPANTRFIQVGAVVGLLVYVATFVDIILGLAFLIASIGLSPEMSVAGLNALRLEDFILPALLVAWLTRVAGRRVPLAKGQIRGPAFVYLCAITASTFVGLAAGTTNLRIASLVFLKFVEYYVIFALVAENVRTPSEFKALTVFTVLVALGGSFLEWNETFLGAGGGMPGRVRGPTGETANIYGGYLTLVLSVTLGLYLHAHSGFHRLAAGLAIVLLGRALLYTYSRTSYAALIVGIVAFAVFKAPRLLFVVAIVTALFPLLAPDSILTRVSTLTGIVAGPGPASWDARTFSWQMHFDQLSGIELLVGRGLGSVRLGDVDSEYIRLLVDTGLLGLAAFLWFLARVGRVAHGTYEAMPHGSFAKGFCSGFLIAFVAISVHAIAATSFAAIRTMECFMALTGLMVALTNRAAEWGLVPESRITSHESQTSPRGPAGESPVIRYS